MALLKGKKSEIPTDAVMLSQDDALKYQIRIMNSWKNKSETFAYRNGGAILGSVSALVGMYINSHYRQRFRLYSVGQISSYLPIVVLPAALSFLTHTEFVLTDVILQKSCVVCSETRSSALQVMTGGVLPTILAPLSAFPLAMQYNTYDVPYITKEPMKVFKLWQKTTRPIANILIAIFIGQALLASTVTYFEAKSIQTVNSRLAKIEYELEHFGKIL